MKGGPVNRIAHRLVLRLEQVVAALLVLITALGVVDLCLEIFDTVSSHPGYLTGAEIASILDTVLVVFIVIELFNIAVAYMTHKSVIPTVLEAALVAVARKLVIFEGGENVLEKAIALSLMMLAVAVSWWLLKRSDALEHVCEYEG